jgi:diaminopimelate decarboxylase
MAGGWETPHGRDRRRPALDPTKGRSASDNRSMAIGSSLSRVFPLGSRVNDLGRLELGGCDAIELAEEFGTPAYVVVEDDLRARARAFRQAALDAGEQDLRVVFASKAFPCSAVLSLFAEEGLMCDVASEGELHLALSAGFAPERIVMHGNAKSVSELRLALRRRVGLIVIDNFDEIARLRDLLGGGSGGGGPLGGEPARGGGLDGGAGGQAGEGGAQRVLIRVAPDVRGETHEKISTGQADTKFGFSVVDVGEAVRQIGEIDGLSLRGLHAHIGSQLLELDPFRREVAAFAKLSEELPGCEIWDLGGGLGARHVDGVESPPEIEEYVSALVEAVRRPEQAGPEGLPMKRKEAPQRLLIEPGRSLTANGCVTLYTVESVKRNVRTWVSVDGGMSDNMRPMLYGARYEAHVADRLGGETRCVLAGKHCESGDVIVAEARLDDPRAGDVVVTPATGAYCYAMASNYNGVLRAPVVFCRDGDARLVVRRDSLEDLTARDVG